MIWPTWWRVHNPNKPSNKNFSNAISQLDSRTTIPFANNTQANDTIQINTHSLKCSLEDYYNGKNVKLKIQRNQACPSCNGRRQIAVNQLCSACSGKGTIRTPNELQFKLPVGCRNGYRKRLKGEGDCPANQIPSDIYLSCEQKKHEIIRRAR